ncbi:MAG: NUDIX hydrolase [Planctomycetes bacterium]|nr:NUDIX hydrolase [Planctomycetota bacterium]
MAEHPQPWTHAGDDSTEDHHIFRVRRFLAADPRDGSRHPRVVLECNDWVNIIPVTDDGRVVLIRQFRFGVWANTLEIPGGMCEQGEDPAIAAARELEEETGYRPARVEPLGFCHPNPAIQCNRTFSYLAHGCVPVHGGRPDHGEDIRVEVVDRDELIQLVREGHITHALVLVAFLLESWRAR